MNNPFDYTPDAVCRKAFRELTARLEAMKKGGDAGEVRFCRELESGKMLGVLICRDADGAEQTLYAFSGQLGDGGFHFPGFVEPVFDYLQPDGYFKRKECEISRLNIEISRWEDGELSAARRDFEREDEKMRAEIALFKEQCRLSKLERMNRRTSGLADESELEAMTRQSQFEKAELHRRKKRSAAALEPWSTRLKEAQSCLDAMKERRKAESESLQRWLFSNFRLLNARGESKSLSEIFAGSVMQIPPSGAGECCAPKLLQAAYRRGWHPVAMAEYWYGAPKDGEVRLHGEHYPACRGKCRPVLGWMLQGLEIQPPLSDEGGVEAADEPKIIFENEWLCVVEKPAGMLSVPGKGRALSVQDWLTLRYGTDRMVKVAHRLDRDTSGLLVATFGAESYKTMQKLFALRRVKKIYVADLDGDYKLQGIPAEGRIELPLIPDLLDRPRQRVDYAEGKEAVTEYCFVGIAGGCSRVMFSPLTGRTHQLRVHSASSSGLAMPIVGDPLYGLRTDGGTDRLHLHAHRLEFTFPLDDRSYRFESPVPF